MFLRSSRKTVALAAALVSILTLNTGAALAACEDRVNRELQDMSVSPDDVKSVEVMRRGAGGKASNNYTLDAWIRLHSCSGYLMIHMTRHCTVQDIYTTGDCRIQGTSNY